MLAIVGVLSIGGIASYSKAMEKFKSNKQLHQLSNILYFAIHIGKTFGTAEDKSSVNNFSIIPVLDATPHKLYYSWL